MMRIASPGPGNGWRQTSRSGIPSSAPTARTSSLNSARSGSTSSNSRSSGRPPTLWCDLIVAAPVPPPDSITSEYSVPCTRNRAPSPPSASPAASSSKTRMNSAPIVLRFVSGSVTPRSLARKRSSASTATSGMPNRSRKAEMTCSPSFLRISPWSTNTHVSWSPTARWTSSAATDESTPPPRAMAEQRRHRRVDAPAQAADDLAVADLRADPADLLLHDRRRRPRHVAAADVAQERLEDVLPVRGVDDLRVELDAVHRALARLERRDRRGGRRRQRGEAGRRLEHRVAVRHPAALVGRQAGEQPPRLADRQLRAPELADLRALDAPAERQRHELHPVADAEHRDAELEQLGIQARRALGAHGPPPAAQDQALRRAPRHLVGAHVVGQQLAEHAALAHTPRDELRVLAAVVQDDNLVEPARRLDRGRLVRELRRRRRLGDDPVLGHGGGRGLRPRPR